MSDVDSEVIRLVESNVSSIDMISETLDVNPDETRTIILRLAETGQIKGHLTLDGARFFRSDAPRSEAPIAAIPDELVLQKVDVKPGIIVVVLGFAAYILGNMLVRMSVEDTFLWGFGGAVTFAGPLIIIAGLLIISQLASSDELGRSK